MVMHVKKTVLPLPYQQGYEAFRQILEQMRPLAVSVAIESMALGACATELQQLFRSQILSLPKGELSLTLQHQVQAYHVEIDKQLRLLSMDVLFLQAARQAATVEQRLGQVRDRLDTLQRYCEALTEQTEAAESEQIKE